MGRDKTMYLKASVSMIVLIALLVAMSFSGCVEQVQKKAPIANFTYLPMEGIYAGTTISFTDTSTDEDGTIASWSWDFGDGETSTEQNPIYAYSEVGTYTAALIVTDNDGNVSEQKSVIIEVTYVPPMADFTYEPMVNITVNQTIEFTDASTIGDANITAWYWDFGDDTNSTVQNPTHAYASVDDYEVQLMVTDANGEYDTKTVMITITVIELI